LSWTSVAQARTSSDPASGFSEVRRIRRERNRLVDAEAIDLDWKAIRPLLHAVVDLWQEKGAPDGYMTFDAVTERLGRTPDDLATIRAAELLAANDWLELAYDDAAISSSDHRFDQ
jgi:hypothetical protein